jgi:CRISPR-associated protein Csb1
VESALVAADFGVDPLRVEVAGRTLSTLQLPHRCFDAVLRDSNLDGVPFRKTKIGRALIAATPANAEWLLRYDPGVLVLGGWDSTELGMAGSSGTKWPAALSVEIAATNVVPVMRAGNRIDPLGIRGTEASLVEEADGTLRVADEADAKLSALVDRNRNTYPRRVKPAQVNHGNVLSLITKGVLVRGSINLAGALSLTRLRRYRFGSVDDLDARTMLALMGIYGVAAVLEDGLDLRRDCELVVEVLSWELVGAGHRDNVSVTATEARQALAEALDRLPKTPPITYTASPALEAIVARFP